MPGDVVLNYFGIYAFWTAGVEVVLRLLLYGGVYSVCGVRGCQCYGYSYEVFSLCGPCVARAGARPSGGGLGEGLGARSLDMTNHAP